MTQQPLSGSWNGPSDPVPLPLVISHSTPENIRRVLASNTVPRLGSSSRADDCCAPKSPRVRCCLCAVGLLPALLLFLLFALVWLSELRLL